MDSVDLVHRVQQKLVAEEMDILDGTELYYSGYEDVVHGHLIAVAEAGTLVPTQESDEFTIPLLNRNNAMVVTLRLCDSGSDSGYESPPIGLLDIKTESDDPWSHVTVEDFLRILKCCVALERPANGLTIREVMSGPDNDMSLMVALNESLGSSMASYCAIKGRLQKAAANIGPDNPLVSYSMPTQEKYALWSDPLIIHRSSPPNLQSLLVSGAWDNTTRIWDAHTGKPIGNPLNGRAFSVHLVAYSPDGAYITSGSFDCTIHIWDGLTRHLHSRPNSPTSPGTMVAKDWTMNEDGLITPGWSGNQLVWVPCEIRACSAPPRTRLVISQSGGASLDLSRAWFSEDWQRCFNGIQALELDPLNAETEEPYSRMESLKARFMLILS
ncbi:hypothetical protein FRC09_003387 [Ceratobasidium sp. 395]|nr:hypothetical protein FRC09_003387 [Ceratobasidium sp. 395]